MVYSRHTKLRILQLYPCTSLALSHNKLNESITSQLSLTLKKIFPAGIKESCRTMILSIPQGLHVPSLRIMVSIGGRHPQSLQMLIQLRISGMSSKIYMRRYVKPHNKDKLVNGIAEFGRLWTRRSEKNIKKSFT